MLKPIILKPATYLALAIVGFLLLICLVGSLWFAAYCFYKKHDPTFASHGYAAHYESIDELLTAVKKHREAKEYQAVIDILKMANTDKLISKELTKPSPRFIVIVGDGPIAHGIENSYDIYDKYKFISFPDTTDFIWDDPGHDFWILWAIHFTSRYNSKLESEMKKKQK